MIDEEGKAERKIGEKWSAILVPSPAASNRRKGDHTAGRVTLEYYGGVTVTLSD